MIAVITPVCNRADLTANFLLQNMMRYRGHTAIRWIIVDNGSTDETPGLLKDYQAAAKLGGQLAVIRNEINQGFSKANNAAARLTDDPEDILLFLNNDIHIRGDYIGIIDRALTEHPLALVGPQLLDYPTGWNIFGDELIVYIAGWCLAMRRRVFEDVNGFDERYTPADYEDADLCYHAQKIGYKLRPLMLPLEHISEQTAITVLKDRHEITLRNREKFALKWGLPNEPDKRLG